MGYLSMNLKVLLWKCKGELANRTYPQYIDHVAQQCKMTPEHFRSCLLDQTIMEPDEVSQIKSFFDDCGYDLSAIDYDFIFRDLIDASTKELIGLNLQYLLSSLEWGDNNTFVEAVGINPSTLSRWKQGVTRPDKESQRQICKYFGYPDAEVLKTGFLFLGLEPVSDQQRRQVCKDYIDRLSREDFDKLYPALLRMLK